MRNPKEIEKDEYHEFYKKTFNEFLDPLAHTHFTTEVCRIFCFNYLCTYVISEVTILYIFSYKFNFALKNVQGEVEFRSVLYIPGMGPLNNDDVVNPKTKNIRLYVKRVFISDDFDGELVSFTILT